MARSHGKIFGLVPYDLRLPTLTRARQTLWNDEDERFLRPTLFGVGWTVNLRSAPRHPFQVLLLVAFILWRIRVGQRRGR